MATTGALLSAPLRAVAMQSQSADGAAVAGKRVDVGWKFRKGPLVGIWQIWRSEEADSWQPVTLPHSFNAYDACDPDQPYFRGQGWYRTRLVLESAFPGGRTILHFQGAGQTTTLWVGSSLVGTHKGGYDEFAFDITEAILALSPVESKQGVPVAVLCDNSPDLDRVPSDLSDFCLYGGLYRHVNLVNLLGCGQHRRRFAQAPPHEAMRKLGHAYGTTFKVPADGKAGPMRSLGELAEDLANRMIGTFTRDARGKRAVHANRRKFQEDPHWRDLVLFYEYFHAETGAGLGASHQTGWTGLVATLIDEWRRPQPGKKA